MSETPPRGVISFDGYRITEIDYRCPSDFEYPKDSEINYNMRLQKKTTLLRENLLEVSMRAEVSWPDNVKFEDATMQTSVEIVGRFSSDSTINIKWETNALAILFPYIRSIFSSITAQSGRVPILLPTVNIAKLFGEKMN